MAPPVRRFLGCPLPSLAGAARTGFPASSDARAAASLAALLAAAVAAPLLAGAEAATAQEESEVFAPAQYRGMQYRMIGPHRGGRVTAVTGIASRPETFYMGATGGGVWKTRNGGESWSNVSDGHFRIGSIGAVQVADSDPSVVYAGTGSACIRGNVSTGRGVYRSTDGGETWTFLGLPEAGQIGAIEVHPRNPDVAYVAALGHPFGENEQRGVFRTTDGGDSWEKVLFLNDSTGVVDLSMNPERPDEIFAAAWSAERKPWTIRSGTRWSDGAGIWRTEDGGDSWTHLSGGLPSGDTLVGKIGVTISPAETDRVWAIVEAGEHRGGVYRSGDGGDSWRRVSADSSLLERPWYYTHITADPNDENTVYVNGELMWRSVDGGKTFETVATPHGDNHDMWISPKDSDVMIQGNDGGANVSYNGGESWSTQNNQPTAQFYSVEVGPQFPYRVYGPQQDNSTISVPSRTPGEAIGIQNWLAVGGCETGPIEVRPDDPDVVYAGCYGGRLTRYDRDTQQRRQIMDYPQMQLGMPISEMKYRFQWNAPIEISPHDPGVLYHGSQHVHRTTNEGQSWEVISPDLTRDIEEYQGMAGGPITHDITGVEVYSTTFAIQESPHEQGTIWVGTNDGLVHITRDGGESWSEVTPEGLPRLSTVNRIEISPHRAGKAYAVAYRYRLDDWAPYVYLTTDYGKSWTRITTGENGIPSDHPTRTLEEDPGREGLLYAGTEFGLFVSFDDGAHWQPLQLNLPRVPVTDLSVRQSDLVVATQGRSFWVLDDLTPLRRLTDSVAHARPGHVYPPATTYRTLGERAPPGERYVSDGKHGATLPATRVGANPEDGAIVYYTLAERPEGPVTVEILEEDGTVVRSFTSDTARAEEGEQTVPVEAGLNRFVWHLRYPGVDPTEDAEFEGATRGPEAVPGTYRVRVSAGDWSQTRTFEVALDPRLEDVSREDLQRQFDLLVRIRDATSEAFDAVRTIRSVRSQAQSMADRAAEAGADGEVRALADTIAARLTAVESELLQVKEDPLLAVQPQLVSQMGWLASIVSSAEARPTDQSYERMKDLEPRLRELVGRVQQVLDGPVAELNSLLEERGVGPVAVPEPGGG